MTDADVMELLHRCEWGTLSTVDADGQPYGVPMNFVLEGGNIYLHCSVEGGLRLSNIAKSFKACFTVVGHTEVLRDKFATRYESVIVFGKAGIVETDEEKSAALLEFIRKYSSDYMEKGMAYINSDKAKTSVIRVTMDHVTGKKRP
jgi:nitroimidazol reductase NimA-like FMN-containing flavoprotein (pyridoxamine 5'-phosphate oxidase superfamily)